MSEDLTPRVDVTETSVRFRSIDGVSTTTTGFVGPTRYGPIDLAPRVLTSLVEFERTYGDGSRLQFINDAGATTEMDNWMWHAAHAFFEEGGRRLYVSRVHSAAGSPPVYAFSSARIGRDRSLNVRARFPGRAGDARVTFTFDVGPDVLNDLDPTSAAISGARPLVDRDVVLIREVGSPVPARGFFLALYDALHQTWNFSPGGADASPMTALADLIPGVSEVRVVTVSVTVDPVTPGVLYVARSLPLDPQRGDGPASLLDFFASDDLAPIVIENPDGLDHGVDLLNAFLADPDGARTTVNLTTAIQALNQDATARNLVKDLRGGNDGARPDASAYAGSIDPSTGRKTGLRQFEDLDDISIVAAPGSTFGFDDPNYHAQARTIVSLLIDHAERMKYRIAVLDSGDGQSNGQILAMRAQFDSTSAALYYPWVGVLDPASQREIYVPPSGFVAGLYVRNDLARGVSKAPVNEILHFARGFERLLKQSDQEALNREGVNCFRVFDGAGMRLWGARTISSDSDWKYVNVRRYFIYLEQSIDQGTQWAVFEPNGEQLWSQVRRVVEDFLFREWQSGALFGEKPEQAYFVKCDRSTMTQNDLDNGRLIVLVGVAPLRPAEFVIFRIGQWTADRNA